MCFTPHPPPHTHPLTNVSSNTKSSSWSSFSMKYGLPRLYFLLFPIRFLLRLGWIYEPRITHVHVEPVLRTLAHLSNISSSICRLSSKGNREGGERERERFLKHFSVAVGDGSQAGEHVQLSGLLQETPSLRITNNGADKSRTAHISSTLRKVEEVEGGAEKENTSLHSCGSPHAGV